MSGLQQEHPTQKPSNEKISNSAQNYCGIAGRPQNCDIGTHSSHFPQTIFDQAQIFLFEISDVISFMTPKTDQVPDKDLFIILFAGFFFTLGCCVCTSLLGGAARER